MSAPVYRRMVLLSLGARARVVSVRAAPSGPGALRAATSGEAWPAMSWARAEASSPGVGGWRGWRVVLARCWCVSAARLEEQRSTATESRAGDEARACSSRSCRPRLVEIGGAEWGR